MSRDRSTTDASGQSLETLSALFDDALEAEAARFARRRLLHDAAWQSRVARWQLAGDVLRGERVHPLPVSFTDRLRVALTHEASILAGGAGQTGPAAAASTTIASPRPPLRRWPWLGGAALAASVAVVALLVWPQAPLPPSASGAATAVADGMPQAASPVAATAGTAAVTAPGADSPRADVVFDTASAKTQASRVASVGASRTARRASARATVPSTLPGTATLANAAPTTLAVAAAASHAPAGDASDPFGLQGLAIPSRPWPRDRFGLGREGAMTTAYEFREPAPGSDDPFRVGTSRTPRALGHAPAAPHTSDYAPVTRDAPP